MRFVLLGLLAVSTGQVTAADESSKPPEAPGTTQAPTTAQSKARKTAEECLKLRPFELAIECLNNLNQPDPLPPDPRVMPQNIYYQIDPEGRIRYQPTQWGDWAGAGPNVPGLGSWGPGTTGGRGFWGPGSTGGRGINGYIYVPPGYGTPNSFMKQPGMNLYGPSWQGDDWANQGSGRFGWR